ncbi:unnamed protein product [Blepharisma stoltei]|uniref:Uncharacterized protein n=1 Tax=Blepharisma stoltei TaxID=1481888 RepID=A0AAU9IA20_9CILI|nr:unnamed protein product [Blepharisma stoltei]
MNSVSFGYIPRQQKSSSKLKPRSKINSLSPAPISVTPKRKLSPLSREQEIRVDLLLKHNFQLLKVLREESRKLRNKTYIPTPYDRMMERCIQNMRNSRTGNMDLKYYPQPNPRPFVKKGHHYAITAALASKKWLEKRHMSNSSSTPKSQAETPLKRRDLSPKA